MICFSAIRWPPAFGLVLLLIAGCNRGGDVAPVKNVQPANKPKSDKEGETWKCADLAAYLKEQGTKLFPFAELTKPNGDIPEAIMFVDDQTALTRKKDNFILDALKEKEAGTGIIIIFRYRSNELAKQQPRAGEGSSLLWGRFLVTVSDSRRGNEKDDNARSKELIRVIRESLGP